ncbi:MAG: hypothetical protein ACE5HL_06255 [Terriglobia bacterium]
MLAFLPQLTAMQALWISLAFLLGALTFIIVTEEVIEYQSRQKPRTLRR